LSKPVHIGCSGWNYREWRGVIYPEGLPARRWLERYAELFDTVEVNATFYRLPSESAVKAWAEQTPRRFVFAVKASRYLTHVKRLKTIGAGAKRFFDPLQPLLKARKLGPVLWQLPENFQRDDDRLGETLEGLPRGRHCFEFRHPSWFTEEVYALLRRHRAALVIGDHPERPFQTHEITASWTYVRFHYGRRGRRGKDLLKFNDKLLYKYKRETVGFVWQNNARNLIPYLTALENVELPMVFTGKARRDKALELLDMVGLMHRKNSKLSQLSGGEQQRVAIAISLANNPRLLLADEPTGAVDSKTSNAILDLFRELNQNLGLTIVIVTHDRQLSKKVDRVVAIRDGRTSSEFIRKKTYAEELAEIDTKTLKHEDDETHVELAVVDKSGRLQIPREYLEAMGIKEKGMMRVELEGDKIVLMRPETDEAKETA
jgi:uncharacterized protein YecE (DUF72 family)